MPRPSRSAYTRLAVDERRRRLLDLGADLFTRFSYDELTMARIAREAGISKALLYHYFPGKQAYFSATLEEKAAELASLTQPDPSLPPLEQLTRGLDAFLGWVEANAAAYGKLVRSAASIPEVREVVDRVREATARAILEGLAPGGPPAPGLRAAVRAWLWFMDGAILDWVEHRDLTREQLRDLLLGTLLGAIAAAGEPAPPAGPAAGERAPPAGSAAGEPAPPAG
jgi:AcrR family transcriptional regulator